MRGTSGPLICTEIAARQVYSQAMLPEIGIGLAAGLVLGFLLAWALGQKQRQRALQLEQQLAERTAALALAQGEREAARRELTVQQQTAAEHDAKQREEIAALKEARTRLENDAERAANAIEELRGENSRVTTDLSALRSTLDAEQKHARQNLDLLTNQFKALANDILEEKSKRFTEQNKENLGSLLTPVGEALSNLQKATQQLEVKREGAYGTVLTEIKNIQETHQSLRRETSQLVQALRAPKARGNWGELQLKRCVEFAGMVEHASFDTQVFVRGEDVSRQPDCVVYLPNGRTIIIDAKTPLDAFLDAMGETDEAARALRLAAHAASVREHLSQLSAKAYWKQFKDSPDFVVCFLPKEVLFSAALEQDPDLIEFGSNSSVILATPTTLIALLKAVAYGWQQMEVTKNAIAIRESGEKLYDKLASAQEYFNKMGRALSSAVGQYNSLIGCLEGRGSVFSQARKLHDLGIGQEELAEIQLLESVTRDLKADDWSQSEGLSLAAHAGKEL